MKLLDLYCGGGGCSVGYHRAGFDEIVGVDIARQPHYPFTFVQADAIEYVLEHGYEFDMIHASPPCQLYSVTASLSNGNHPDLIDKTRDALRRVGKPYVIENVPGAPLVDAIVLCGTMFGLRVLRHRLFETWPVQVVFPPATCQHNGKATGNAYRKDGLRVTASFAHGYQFLTITGHDFLASDARQAMDIDWLPKSRLAQAIPPAYTEWLGRQMIDITLSTVT